MRTYVAGTVCAVLLGVASLAQAGQLLSPPYSVKTRGSNVGTKAACVIRNTGNEPATVSVSLITNNNDAVGIFDFCKLNGKPRTLAGGETCLVSADLSGGPAGLNTDVVSPGSYVACKVTAPNVLDNLGILVLHPIRFAPLR